MFLPYQYHLPHQNITQKPPQPKPYIVDIKGNPYEISGIDPKKVHRINISSKLAKKHV